MKSNFIRLLSTATKNPTNNASGYWPSLVKFEINASACLFECSPNFDATRRSHRYLLFENWWSSEVIYQFGYRKIRRRDLILTAANKDGGAHVDLSLPPNYQWIVDGTGWKINFRPDNGPEREVFLQNAHFAALRQIAHEVLNSPELIKLAER